MERPGRETRRKIVLYMQSLELPKKRLGTGIDTSCHVGKSLSSQHVSVITRFHDTVDSCSVTLHLSDERDDFVPT
jgi:hypothetical protein